MKRYLKELVLLIAVFGGLPFDVATDSAYAQTPPLRVNGVKFGPSDKSVYVTAYGAKGDGSTDDTAAIAAAITALGSTPNAELVFPSGTYRVTAISVSGVTGLTLRGLGATIVGTVEASSQITLTNCTRCKVIGFDIKEATQSVRSGSNHGIGINTSSDILIQGNTISLLTGAGVFITGSSHVIVRDNYVHDTMADGIHTTGVSTDVLVQGNRLVNTGDDSIAVVSYQADAGTCKRVNIVGNNVYQGNTRGITVVGGEQVTISGNVVESTSGAGLYVAQEVAIPTYGVNNVDVVGNVVKDADTYASVIASQSSILVNSQDAAFPINDIHIANNIVIGGGYRFINAGSSLANAVNGISVHGNKCYGPNTAAAGIEFDKVSNGSITDNSVFFAFTTGIFVDSTSVTIVVAGNFVYYPNQAFSGWNGVDNQASAGWTGINYVTADPGKPLSNDVRGTNTAGTLKMFHALQITGAFATAGLSSKLSGAFNLLTTTTEGWLLENTTASDAVNTVQDSPCQTFGARAWNTSSVADQPMKFWVCNTPASGNPISGSLRFYAQVNGGSISEIGRMNSNGAWVINTSLLLGNAADNTGNLGSGTQRPAQVWGMRHMLGQTTVAAAATTNINTSTAGGSVRLTLGTNVTSMTIAAGNAGEILTLELIQDSTGGRTMPASWTNVVFASGGSFTVTPTLSKRDVLQFVYDATDAKWYERSRSQNL